MTLNSQVSCLFVGNEIFSRWSRLLRDRFCDDEFAVSRAMLSCYYFKRI